MKKKPTRRSKLPRLLDQADEIFAVVDVDMEVLYANERCCQWLGVEKDELVGMTLQYSASPGTTSEATPQARANGLCPPPHLAGDGPIQEMPPGSICSSSGPQRIWKRASWLVLTSADQSNRSILIHATGPDLQEPPENPGLQRRYDEHHVLAALMAAEKRWLNQSSLVGSSAYAHRLRRQVQAVVGNQSDCLIVGPPGSGREHLARTIFHSRKQPGATMLPIHCTIADSQLLQNQIKDWVFEQRENQTQDWLLLLDVDQLSTEGQSELLGYAQLPGFQLRVIATASTSLLGQANAHQFSFPLAMHLSIQTIETVALRQRSEDVPLLAQWFIESRNQDSRRQVSGLDDETLEIFAGYPWPRNIDELKQVIDASYDHCTGSRIGTEDLPDFFQHAIRAVRVGYRTLPNIQLEDYLAQIERELISRALQQTNHNKTQAADILGISRAKLIRRASALDISSGPTTEDTSQVVDESAFKEAKDSEP